MPYTSSPLLTYFLYSQHQNLTRNCNPHLLTFYLLTRKLPWPDLAKTEKREKSSGKQTPLMKQYFEVKAQYPGSILLFRVGDFYETFGEDAVEAAKVLGIVLTHRNNGGSDVELAGFPHHSLDTYLPKLVRTGKRVAVCDQLEDPKQAKGIVKRGVTELVTPGVTFNDKVLEVDKHNYLAAVHFVNQKECGAAFH